MSTRKVSENELRTRLASSMSEDQIEELINLHTETSLEELPVMNEITRLSKKKSEGAILRVSFRLSEGQYEALANYFKEDGQAGTILSKRAVEEFIRQIEA